MNITCYNYTYAYFFQMLRLAVISCLLVAAFGLDAMLNSEWEAFKISYNKQYDTNNEMSR